MNEKEICRHNTLKIVCALCNPIEVTVPDASTEFLELEIASRKNAEEYYAGKGCKCAASSEANCCCDVDWTDLDVYKLREQLKQSQARIAELEEKLIRAEVKYRLMEL